MPSELLWDMDFGPGTCAYVPYNWSLVPSAWIQNGGELGQRDNRTKCNPPLPPLSPGIRKWIDPEIGDKQKRKMPVRKAGPS